MSLLELLFLDSHGPQVLVLVSEDCYLLVLVQVVVVRSVFTDVRWHGLACVSLLPSFPCGRLERRLDCAAEIHIFQQVNWVGERRRGFWILTIALGPVRFLFHFELMETAPLIICDSLHFLLDVIWFIPHHHFVIVWLHVQILISVFSVGAPIE